MYLIEVMALTVCSKEYISSFPPELQEIIIDYLFDYTKHSSQQVYIHDMEDLCVYNELNFHISEEKIKENIFRQKLDNFIKKFYCFDPDDFIIEYTDNKSISIKTGIYYDQEIKEQIVNNDPNSHILKFLLEKDHKIFVFFEKQVWDSILTSTLKKNIILKNIKNVYYYSNKESILYSKYKDIDEYDEPECDLSVVPDIDLICNMTGIELICNMTEKKQKEITSLDFCISYDYEPDPYDYYTGPYRTYYDE